MIYGPNNIPSPSSYVTDNKEIKPQKAMRFSGKHDQTGDENNMRDQTKVDRSDSRRKSQERIRDLNTKAIEQQSRPNSTDQQVERVKIRNVSPIKRSFKMPSPEVNQAHKNGLN